jgi:2-oxoglutarate dehydrogenase E2 component (dihydrolipoamide succinyltransferase)
VLIEVKVPVLAESVAEATLMNWYKKPGDTVVRGDSLIDIETDKVTLEVAAPNDGILQEILKGDGEDVASDEVIARIETEAGAAKTSTVEKRDSIPEQQSLPVGDAVEKTPKLSPAVRHMLEEHNITPGDIQTGGDRLTKEDILEHLDKGQTAVQPQPAGQAQPRSKPPLPPPAKPLPEVKPEPALAPVSKPAPAPAAKSAPPQAPADERPEKRVPMTRLRQRTAERLLNAQHENAILTTFNEINMGAVMDLRNRYKDDFEKTHGIKLGFMSFFTKAVIEALKKFPVVNASVDGNDMIYHGFFDIGIAVSSEKGLVVPVIRDADLLSFAQIESRVAEYGDKARKSKLTMQELTGGTFTITNGGIFGSLLSTPILNPPQSAILGMHAIQERPVAENSQVVIRPMMYVALSYDHRIIDGREAVQFLMTIKKQVEDPARLLFEI